MIVTFCGHRDFVETAEAENQLTMFLEKYARENVRLVCYNGGYGNFDYFAAKCVQRMQEQYSNIRNCLVLPYIDQPFLERIEIFKNHFDETIYPPLESVPRKYAIIRRNEWMVRFYTVDKSHNGGGGGFGLGLAIVKKLCKRAGWKLSVESELGVGTEFKIEF